MADRAAAAAAGRATKLSKDEVDYSLGVPGTHCGNCRFFSDRMCQRVEGDINPRFWCRLWQARHRQVTEHRHAYQGRSG